MTVIPPQAAGRRWFAVGASGADGPRAGRDAAAAALAGDDPRLFVVFASGDLDLEGIVGGIRAVAPGVPLVGCTTAGEIGPHGPGGGGLVVSALGGEGFRVATAAATDASHRLRDAGAEAAGCIRDVAAGEHTVLMLLSDALSGDQREVVRGAYSVAGVSVPLVGGCAGDDLRRTRQVCGDRVLHDAVVGAAIVSEAPLGIGVRHGWRRIGEPMLVTLSRDNRVYTLDDRPALDVYLEHLGADDSLGRDAAAFTRFALTHPLGLRRRSTEEVRFVGGADRADGSLSCIAEVPQGGLVWLMEGDSDSVMDGAAAACADALAALGDRPPLGLIAFDCIARRGVLGDHGVGAEVDVMTAAVGGAPVAGFYTYGEIARVRGISGFHNQTLVALALS